MTVARWCTTAAPWSMIAKFDGTGASMAGSRLFTASVCALLLASTAGAGGESSPEALGQIIDQAVARVPQWTGLAIAATQANVRAGPFHGQTGNDTTAGRDHCSG